MGAGAPSMSEVALAVKRDAEAGRLIAAEASLDSLGTRERR